MGLVVSEVQKFGDPWPRGSIFLALGNPCLQLGRSSVGSNWALLVKGPRGVKGGGRGRREKRREEEEVEGKEEGKGKRGRGERRGGKERGKEKRKSKGERKGKEKRKRKRKGKEKRRMERRKEKERGKERKEEWKGEKERKEERKGKAEGRMGRRKGKDRRKGKEKRKEERKGKKERRKRGKEERKSNGLPLLSPQMRREDRRKYKIRRRGGGEGKENREGERGGRGERKERKRGKGTEEEKKVKRKGREGSIFGPAPGAASLHLPGRHTAKIKPNKPRYPWDSQGVHAGSGRGWWEWLAGWLPGMPRASLGKFHRALQRCPPRAQLMAQENGVCFTILLQVVLDRWLQLSPNGPGSSARPLLREFRPHFATSLAAVVKQIAKARETESKPHSVHFWQSPAGDSDGWKRGSPPSPAPQPCLRAVFPRVGRQVS
ncbi:Splicing regulatory glutamine/lysine-rich protein 1, partial [Ophiophagus hannah]